MRRTLVYGLLLLTSVAFAQDLRVSASNGIAEIRISDSGWLQAVSGREFPVGGMLSTWVDASVSFAGGGATVSLGQLSILSLEASGDSIDTTLIAGSVQASATDTAISVKTRVATIRASTASFSYADGLISVTEGTVDVEYARGGSREIAAPATVDLRPAPLLPFVQSE